MGSDQLYKFINLRPLVIGLSTATTFGFSTGHGYNYTVRHDNKVTKHGGRHRKFPMLHSITGNRELSGISL